MADAAIFCAVNALGVLVAEKAGFLQGVEEKVKWLKNELKRMQCFLKDAAEKQAQNESIRQWISDIREVAQDANDVIETFILKFDTPRSSEGSLRRLIYFPKHLYHLNMVGKEIDSIKAKLEDIESSRVRYGIQNLGEMTESSTRSEVGEVEWRRRLSPWQKDEHVVGLERDMKLLLENAILDGREGLAVAAVVGMGGIGKSTLAKKVYNHSGVVKQFDIRAWVVVSSDFRPRDIIKELMLQLLEPKEDKLKLVETMEKLPLPSVQQMLHERLCSKRYFIVLDDLWENKHWESLASVFPVEGQGSRLLLTSRDRNITKHARYIHEMKLLGSKESWKLFMKKAFIDNNEGKCPEDLFDIGREILRKCEGLPLAISVVGGLLVDRSPSKSKWENVLEKINSHLGTRESSVSEILELSYRNLSPELKSCFLCIIGFFKEDAVIPAKKLIQVWIAQGLIEHERRGEYTTMEEIGQNYLDELFNRNMVQVKDMSYDGSLKNCHIHDLLRELSIRKAKEEISFEIRREDGSSQSLDKPRHRVVYCSTETFIYSAGKNKYLRSLFFHGSNNPIDVKPSYWKSFELLKILDFEDFKLLTLPNTIGELTGLRYLGLRNTTLILLPRSLGRLKKLEVLDVAKNNMCVRNVIWKMDNLRHIYMDHGNYIEAPLRIDTRNNLHTLSYIWMDSFVLNHLTQLASLRTLGIATSSSNLEFSTLCSDLKNLVCLKVRIIGMFPTRMDTLGTMCNLTKLKLEGKLSKLTDLPPNLSYLTLVDAELRHDPMPVLEKLPKLLGLKLDCAYKGQKMEVSKNGFPRLKVLILRHMWDLETIKVGKGGGMQELKRLEIYACFELVKGLSKEMRLITIMLEE